MPDEVVQACIHACRSQDLFQGTVHWCAAGVGPHTSTHAARNGVLLPQMRSACLLQQHAAGAPAGPLRAEAEAGGC